MDLPTPGLAPTGLAIAFNTLFLSALIPGGWGVGGGRHSSDYVGLLKFQVPALDSHGGKNLALSSEAVIAGPRSRRVPLALPFLVGARPAAPAGILRDTEEDTWTRSAVTRKAEPQGEAEPANGKPAFP